MAFAKLGNLKAAEERLLKATQLPEPSVEAHFNLGLLYAEQGRNKDAEKALYKVIELDPENATAACNLAILKAGNDYPETFRLLKLAIKSDPNNPRHVHTLAYYYMETKNFKMARETIDEAIARGLNTQDILAMRRQLMQNQLQNHSK